MKLASKQFTQCGMILGALILIGTCLNAADWPHFMGSTSDGVSPEKGLVRQWPDGKAPVLWTLPLGLGYGNAAVKGGKVYLLDRVDEKDDVLRCLDLSTGKEQWQYKYSAPGRISHDGSRSTPAVTDKHVYFIGPFGDFHCLDLATHKVVWKKNLLKDYGAQLPRWAVSQSPVLYKNWVLAAPQGGKTGIVAYDQNTGKEIWSSGALGSMAYASPRIITLEGTDHAIIINTSGVVGVNAENGKILWKYSYLCKIPIPNVTDLGGGKFFVTGGYQAGSAIIQVNLIDSAWKVKEITRIPQIGGHCHPGLVFKNHIYVLCNTNERSDGMVCFDFDCKIVWQTQKNPYLCKGGSVLTGDGIIYVMDGATGELHIMEPSAESFKSLSKVKILEGKEIWAPLVLADGKLLIRDQTQMKCLDLRPR